MDNDSRRKKMDIIALNIRKNQEEEFIRLQKKHDKAKEEVQKYINFPDAEKILAQKPIFKF